MLLAGHVILVLALVARCAAKGVMRRHNDVNGLRSALEQILAGDQAQRLFVVEGILRATFEAFPKNSKGKIVMQSLHSMARDYFASEHGWLLSGFEFTGARSTKLSDAKLLHEKSPKLVTALQQAEKLEEGLSLSDTVAAVAAVEHFVLEESKGLLHRAYELNELPLTQSLKEQGLEDILSSYLMLFRKGIAKNKKTDARAHQEAKPAFMKNMADEGLTAFYKESVDGYGAKSEYALADSQKIVQDMTLRYGKWQNNECELMKKALVDLDSDHSGRVPWDVFHAQPTSPHYSFTESTDYLRKHMALDESHADKPTVMIANYLAMPSNCIAWSDYFSVCCLNECESLVNELEGRVQTSDVPVDKLIETVAAIPSGTVSVPRELPERLVELAKDVAAIHGGVVPLQSGDFRRWFHFAFPNECPYPTDLEASVAEGERDASERWLGGRTLPTGLPEADVPAKPAVPTNDL